MTYQFRDPIHGFIEVSEEELRIINSAQFLRLRNIRQLATTYLVYHGAEHSRFGHSLGVMHLTSRVFDSIVNKTPHLFSEDSLENNLRILRYRQMLRIIGLVHDLGHAPFSHASEDLFPNKKVHEDYTREILFNTEIGEYIFDIGAHFRKEYGEDYDITPELIWMIYEGQDITNPKFIVPDFMLLGKLMDGELDCDKMDYLLRDSLYCGVSYGKYDLNRFLSTIVAVKKNNHLQLAVEKGGVQAFEEFVLARYFMFIQVYFHKTRRCLDRMLIECLKRILPDGRYPESVDEYLSWDDNRVLDCFAHSDDPLIKDFCKRKIKTCVYESKAHAETADASLCNIIYNGIKNKYADQIYYDKVDKAAHKLFPIIPGHDDDSDKEVLVFDEKTGETTNIMEESIILSSLIKPISINRIYADKDIATDVRNDIKRMKKDNNT